MFRKITRLLFGGDEQTADEAKPGETAEEGWLMVNHQEAEAGGCENQDDLLAAAQQSHLASQGDAPANTENNRPSLAEPSALRSGPATSRPVASYVPQPEAEAELTRVACAHKAKAWADRRHASRNAIQRQNHVLHAAQHNSFHLQQPGHRSLGH